MKMLNGLRPQLCACGTESLPLSQPDRSCRFVPWQLSIINSSPLLPAAYRPARVNVCLAVILRLSFCWGENKVCCIPNEIRRHCWPFSVPARRRLQGSFLLLFSPHTFFIGWFIAQSLANCVSCAPDEWCIMGRVPKAVVLNGWRNREKHPVGVWILKVKEWCRGIYAAWLNQIIRQCAETHTNFSSHLICVLYSICVLNMLTLYGFLFLLSNL